MKNVFCLVAVVVMLACTQGCDSNSKSGQPKLQNPNDPKVKAMQPAKPGGAGTPVPNSQ